jgi:hypothetical protein
MTLKSVCPALAAGILATLLSACSTPGADSISGQQVASANQVCTTDAPIGSSIAKKTCHAPMTQEQRDALERDITLRGQPKPIIKQ